MSLCPNETCHIPEVAPLPYSWSPTQRLNPSLSTTLVPAMSPPLKGSGGLRLGLASLPVVVITTRNTLIKVLGLPAPSFGVPAVDPRACDYESFR